MKISTRIYLDATLQNIKSVTFFTFLQVLIARLGASNFEIALSNCLPPLFCALSLAFLTRQLPVTRGVFLTSGYIRQIAFLCMAFSVLIPHPVPYLIFFWTINCIAVMVTGAQQPAIIRKWVEPSEFPRIFNVNKIINIIIMTSGSFILGIVLDASDAFFPKNFFLSMLIGCLSTFLGMSLIAGLVPGGKGKIQLKAIWPFQEYDRTLWWMGLNNVGIAMVVPLFTIYHVKSLYLTNTQISYFVITTGIVSSIALPLIRRWMERIGIMKVYGMAILGMAITIFPYGFIDSFWMLIVLQAWVGVCLAVNEVASNLIMMNAVEKHKNEMAYFSDFQLVMNMGNAVGALITACLLTILPLWACFITISMMRVLFFFCKFVLQGHKENKLSYLSSI